MLSPIQFPDLQGKWMPKGTPFQCIECGKTAKTRANILLLPNEAIICAQCCGH